MKKYGILPQALDPAKTPIDCYDTDRRYFQSSWYYPPGTPRPKLHNNDAHYTKP